MTVQLLLTLFVVALLWCLHARLRKQEFFRLWAWAWTAYGVFLALGLAAPALPQGWTPLTSAAVLVSTIAGFVQFPLLVFGATRFHAGAKALPRRTLVAGVALAAAAGAAAFAASAASRGDPVFAESVRLVPRALALPGAWCFCAFVLLARWRDDRGAAGVMGASCLIYGIDHALLGLAELAGARPGGAAAWLPASLLRRSEPFLVDLVCTLGIVLGMVLMLLERHEQAERALGESAALRESEARYRALVSASAQVVWRANGGGEDVLVTPGWQELTGQTDEQLRTEGCLAAVHPEDQERVGVLWREAVAAARPYEFEMRVRARDGSHRWFHTRGVPVVAEDGSVREWVGANTDITESRAGAEALRQVQERNRAILLAIPDMMFLQDRHGTYLDAHARDPRVFLVPPERFLGRNMRDVLPPELAARFQSCIEATLQSGEPGSFEYDLAIRGETCHYESRSIRCDGDKVLSIVRDITERKRAEHEARVLRDELAHVGRVSLLSTLTGSIAHEINQPLAAMMANAAAAQRMLAGQTLDVEELRQVLADIVEDNRRAGDVLHRLRALLSKETTEHGPLDLEATVDDVLKLVRSDVMGRGIALEVDVAPRLPLVQGDRVQLQQVLLNLLLNAFEAVRDLDASERRVRLSARCASDGGVALSVADQGAGVSDSELPRIFEPFYTTKRGGMGLGLPICQTIAAAHGGRLEAERNAGRGMTFSLLLPAALPAQTTGHGPAPAATR